MGKARLETANARFDRMYIPEPNSGCWIWIGACPDPPGYGRINILGEIIGTHRFSYERFIGPIPEGMLVCHKCDTRCCVNPDHFFLGDHAANGRDASQKGRLCAGQRHYLGRKTHCKRGHLFDSINTLIGTKGERRCRACLRILGDKYRGITR